MTVIRAVPFKLDLTGDDNGLTEGNYWSRIITILDATLNTALNFNSSGTGALTYNGNVPKAKFVDVAGSTTGTPGIVNCSWVSNGQGGQLKLEIPYSVMHALTKDKGTYDIMIKDDAGNVERIVYGDWAFQVARQVTTAGDP